MKNEKEFKEELLRRSKQRTAAKHRHTKILITCTSLVLCLALLAVMVLRPTTVHATDLMADITPGTVTGKAPDDAFISSQTDFALRLFKACYGETAEKNTLVSPLSVMLALSMTANGADGQTKAEMETVLGLPIEELNQYLYDYANHLSTTENAKVSIANSIWYRDADFLHVKPSFLQTTADYYAADAYKAPFDDSTIQDINNWTKENTDGMIDKILEEIPDRAVMYLINALVFDAKWSEPYTESTQISTRTFTAFDGTQQSVTMMHNTESVYLTDGMATGFLKYYEGNDYAFAALLPNEGVSIQDYVNSLTGEKLQNILNSAQQAPVSAVLPQFSYDYGLELSGVLAQLGMPTAFDDWDADFTPMATSDRGNIFFNRVLHKTHITVDTQGTRAAAVTMVEMMDGGSMIQYSVILNRPFVYLIIDTATNLPLFIGTVLSIEG